MKTSKQNFIIDALAFIFFVFLTTTGIIVHYLLPAGSGHSSAIWGWSRHDWGEIHFYMALGFLLILAFHLFKHWKWIFSLVKGRKRQEKGRRALLGLVGLVAILIIGILPLASPVQKSDTKRPETSEHRERSNSVPTIKGSMSLEDIETLTGVPSAYLIKELKLPANVSKNKRLKELKTEHVFEMEKLRELVSHYQNKN